MRAPPNYGTQLAPSVGAKAFVLPSHFQNMAEQAPENDCIIDRNPNWQPEFHPAEPVITSSLPNFADRPAPYVETGRTIVANPALLNKAPATRGGVVSNTKKPVTTTRRK